MPSPYYATVGRITIWEGSNPVEGALQASLYGGTLYPTAPRDPATIHTQPRRIPFDGIYQLAILIALNLILAALILSAPPASDATSSHPTQLLTTDSSHPSPTTNN